MFSMGCGLVAGCPADYERVRVEGYNKGMTYPVHPVADLFPMLPDDEMALLVADVAEKGLDRPITVTADGVLLDGRNRLEACVRAGVEPRTEVYAGADPVGLIVSRNLRTRHLTVGQRAMLAVALEPFLSPGQGARTDLELRADLPEVSENDRRSREKAAKIVGVSGRAVAQAKRIVEEAPDLAEQVRAGFAVDRADRIIRDRQAEDRRIEQAATETPAGTALVSEGDFRSVFADLPDGSVDAIITDPPYPAEYLPLLADLAVFADRVLTTDGVLAVLLGQTHLEEAFRLLSGHRPYRWTMAYMTPGNGYVSHARRVQSNWKPVLVYGGGPRIGDVVTAGGDAGAKDLHDWGQDYRAFHDLIGRLTLPGQTVCDPFAGAGTTLLAAKSQGRHAIGCDTDPAYVETMRRRLGL